MKNIVENNYGEVTVVEHSDYKWGVIDSNGNEIVPFGKYDWIEGFEHGLCRVKIGNQPSNLRELSKMVLQERSIFTTLIRHCRSEV